MGRVVTGVGVVARGEVFWDDGEGRGEGVFEGRNGRMEGWGWIVLCMQSLV